MTKNPEHDDKKSTPAGDEASSLPGEAEAVGYKKPPKHTQFKKGKSGNPSGKPKKTKSLHEHFLDFNDTPMPVVLDGKREKRKPPELLPRILFAQGQKGNSKSLGLYVKRSEQAEAWGARRRAAIADEFSWDDQTEIIQKRIDEAFGEIVESKKQNKSPNPDAKLDASEKGSGAAPTDDPNKKGEK
jgi:hypothetical protein